MFSPLSRTRVLKSSLWCEETRCRDVVTGVRHSWAVSHIVTCVTHVSHIPQLRARCYNQTMTLIVSDTSKLKRRCALKYFIWRTGVSISGTKHLNTDDMIFIFTSLQCRIESFWKNHGIIEMQDKSNLLSSSQYPTNNRIKKIIVTTKPCPSLYFCFL